jgi:hypothetical protein
MSAESTLSLTKRFLPYAAPYFVMSTLKMVNAWMEGKKLSSGQKDTLVTGIALGAFAWYAGWGAMLGFWGGGIIVEVAGRYKKLMPEKSTPDACISLLLLAGGALIGAHLGRVYQF